MSEVIASEENFSFFFFKFGKIFSNIIFYTHLEVIDLENKCMYKVTFRL